MDVVILIVAIAVTVALLLVVALGVVAKSADGSDHQTGWLSALVALRSPSGKPFFASRKAMRDFVETLDDVEDDEPKRDS
jgi:hypothetical protein